MQTHKFISHVTAIIIVEAVTHGTTFMVIVTGLLVGFTIDVVEIVTHKATHPIAERLVARRKTAPAESVGV